MNRFARTTAKSGHLSGWLIRLLLRRCIHAHPQHAPPVAEQHQAGSAFHEKDGTVAFHRFGFGGDVLTLAGFELLHPGAGFHEEVGVVEAGTPGRCLP